MAKYIVPLVNENGVIKTKYEFKRKKGVKVYVDVPRGVAIVTSRWKIKELEDKEDVKKE